MYIAENLATKEKHKLINKVEVLRLTGLSGNYIDRIVRTGKVTKDGWKITKLKWE